VAVRRKLTRYYGAGDLHFITCSCYRRQPLLGTPRRRDLFLTVLEQVRRRYHFVVAGYVIMPEHIHLLIGEPQVKTPSTVMQALKLGFCATRSGAGEAATQSNSSCSVRRAPATHLAETVLRFQRVDRTLTHRKTSLHASESGEARLGGLAGTLALEQFPRLLPARGWSREGQ
jgi:REP element-mobilizing transposase RayT